MTYEIRLYRENGVFSLLCFVNFVSDRHAVSSARFLLNERLPSAEVWQDGRKVADVTFSSKIAA